MELNEIIGHKLISIQKTKDAVKLLFKGHARYMDELSFKGFLFETSSPGINKQVIRTELQNVLGFKALNELKHQNLTPSDYKQLLIQMNEGTEEYKIELICVFKAFKLEQITRGSTTKIPLSSSRNKQQERSMSM